MQLTWRRFVAYTGGYRVRLPSTDEGKYTKGETLTAVLRLAMMHNGDHLAEIGTAYGATTVKLAHACPASRVSTFDVCLDLVPNNPSPYAEEVPPRSLAGVQIKEQPIQVRDRITAILEHPSTLRERVRELGPYGMIFIDGDHTWRSLIEDTRVALECVTPGSTIVWDDYTTSGEIHAALDIINHRCWDRVVYVNKTRLCYASMDEDLLPQMRKAVVDL
jgi:predicted O-methyltransferase YrrM